MPNRTMEKRVTGWPEATWVCAMACSTISARRLLAPITLVGRTALSVLTSTKSLTPHSAATRAVIIVPRVLFLTPSAGLCSTIGTCL
ncbi:hypothetical protein D3C71_1953780 [compost metagenome]